MEIARALLPSGAVSAKTEGVRRVSTIVRFAHDQKGGLSPHPHLRDRSVPAAALCGKPQLVSRQEGDVLAGAPALGPVRAAALAPGTPARVAYFHHEVPAPPDPAGSDLPPHCVFSPVGAAELPAFAQPG